MKDQKCLALVDGKECGLALVLVEQDLDNETEIYECPLGHRKDVLLGETMKRKCSSLIDGKECGLALSVIDRDLDSATEVSECPLGHRTYVPTEPEVIEVES